MRSSRRPLRFLSMTLRAAWRARRLASLTLRVADSTNLYLWIAYGWLWALALLTNPALGVALPFLFVWAALRAGWRSRKSWFTPALSLAVIFLCVLPWTVRNYERFHRFIPVRSSLH